MDIKPAWIANLPPASVEKLLRLAEDRDVAHAPLAVSFDDEGNAIQLLRRARDRLTDVQQSDRYRPSSPELASATELAEANVSAREADLARVRERRVRAVAAWKSCAFLDDTVSWLRDNTSLRFRHAAAEPPKVPGGDYVAVVARVRDTLEKKHEEFAAIKQAPATAAELHEAMMAAVDAAASRGTPAPDFRIRSGDPFRIERGLYGPEPVRDFLIWLMRDQIAERLDAMIGEDRPNALTYEAREAAFAKISADMLALARQEEALIVAAAERGQTIPRRREADPRAILEIEEA